MWDVGGTARKEIHASNFVGCKLIWGVEFIYF